MEYRKYVHGVPGKTPFRDAVRLRTALVTDYSDKSNNDDPETSAFNIKAPGLQELVDAAALNSNIKFDRTDVPFAQRNILGDATETGLARFVGRCLSDYDAYNQKHRKVFEVPVSSVNKWALVIVSFVMKLLPALLIPCRWTSRTRMAS